MKLFGGTFQALETSLDYAMLKNRTISNNIANVDTPGYKAKDVDFKQVFSNALTSNMEAKRSHEKHIPFSNDGQAYSIRNRKHTSYNHNGNNVDIDKEMAELAKNQIYYQSLVDRINGKFSSLQTVVKGGS